MRRNEVSRLEAAVVGANPVPRASDLVDSKEAAVVTLLVEQRRHTMTATPTQPAQDTPAQPRRSDAPGGAPPSQSWRRPVIAFGTAFVILIVALGIIYATGAFESAPDVADTVPTTVATPVSPPTTVETQTRGGAQPVITSWDRDESIEGHADHFIGLSRDQLLMGSHIYTVVDGELVPGENLPANVFDNYGAVGTNDGVWALVGNTLLTYVEEDGWVSVATVPPGRHLSPRWDYSYSLEASSDGVVWVLKDTWHKKKEGLGCRDEFRWDGDKWRTRKCKEFDTLGPDGVRWDLRGGFLFEDGSVGHALRRIEGDTVETFHVPGRPTSYLTSWAPADGSYWICDYMTGAVYRFYQGTWSQPLATDSQLWQPGPGAFIGPDGALWGIIETDTGTLDIVAFHGEEPTTILADAELGWRLSVAPDGTIWTNEPTEPERIRRIVVPET